MNVLAIVTFKIYPPLMGGQKGVALFYQHLSGHQSIVMAASADNTPDPPASIVLYPVLFPNKKIAGNVWKIGRLKKIIKAHHIDCIIAEHSYSGWLGYLLKKLTGVPFILHSHNIESYRFRHMNKRGWKAYWYYERWIHQQADFNFFISNEDMEKAVRVFQLKRDRCEVITYGIEKKDRIPNAKEQLRSQLGLKEEVLLFFNGTLDYVPNVEAVYVIIRNLIPLLRQHLNRFKIIITGNRITLPLQEMISATPEIIYVGYVEDINLYYQGVNLFINPVTNDSGVKTKVIEALANDCTVISTRSGASGVPKEVAETKLRTVQDNDWVAFIYETIAALKDSHSNISDQYYMYFSWQNIVAQASKRINSLCQKHD